MLWEALASAGCGIDIEERPENYTGRRSLPHAGEWPNLIEWMVGVKHKGYEVIPLYILRDWYATIQSVLKREEDRDSDQIEWNMTHALYKMAFTTKSFNKSMYITYESFCLHPEFRRWLFCDKLGLLAPNIEIKYANEKYYE